MFGSINIEEQKAVIISLVSEQSGVPVKDIQSNHTLEHLNMDSLDIIELCMIIEDHYEIEIPDRLSLAWTTVQSVIDGSIPFILGKEI